MSEMLFLQYTLTSDFVKTSQYLIYDVTYLTYITTPTFAIRKILLGSFADPVFLCFFYHLSECVWFNEVHSNFSVIRVLRVYM